MFLINHEERTLSDCVAGCEVRCESGKGDESIPRGGVANTVFRLIDEKQTVSETGVGGKARFKSGMTGLFTSSHWFLLSDVVFLIRLIQLLIVLPGEIYMANLLFFKELVTGFLASSRGLVDKCLRFGVRFGVDPFETRFGVDPVSSEIVGTDGSSMIPLSASSL